MKKTIEVNLRSTIGSPRKVYLGEARYVQDMRQLDLDLELLRDGLKRLPVAERLSVMLDVASILSMALSRSGAA